jgi:nickel-dependent lactate racemase
MSDPGPSFAERALASVQERRFSRVGLTPLGPSGSLLDLCRDALRSPVASPGLSELSTGARRIAVLISDSTRDEPREEMLDALFEILPRSAATLVVATGTHGRGDDVVPSRFRDLPVVVHEGTDLASTVDLGTTSRGTRVRVLREAAEADLIVVTGRIRPHYFAGYSGGVKGLFPGCAYKEDILKNHLLKADPTARLGRTDGNVCRADMEEAARLVKSKVFVLNVLADCDGSPRRAASGDPIAAHRALVADAKALFSVRVPRAPVVVVADRPPVTRSLYQASKLLPPAGAVLEDGGTVVLLAECDKGIEPVERVNEGIYRLGVARALPPSHRVILVSTLPRETVARSYAEYAPDLSSALDMARAGRGDVIPVIWRAGEAIVEAA